jgi:hemolysin-activating ACP:hemolysin acyltransferase
LDHEAAAGPGAAADPSGAKRFAADARAAAFGRIVALLMASPRHSGMTLADAQSFLTPAIAHGQLAILGTQQGEDGPTALAAAAWWAMVSPEVDQRLTQSHDAHLTLDAADWHSGDQPWIIETIGDTKVVNELMRRLAERTFTGKPAKLRARLPDGRIAVGRLERKPAGGSQTKA